MLAEQHPLEKHLGLFFFQLWRRHSHCGKWIGFPLAKSYLFVYICGSVLMTLHTQLCIVEGKRQQSVYSYEAHQ